MKTYFRQKLFSIKRHSLVDSSSKNSLPPVQVSLMVIAVSNQTKSFPFSSFIFRSRTLFVKLWTNLSWAIYDSLPVPSQPPKGLPAVASAPNAACALFPKNPQIRDCLHSKGFCCFVACTESAHCSYMQRLPNKVFIMGAPICLLLLSRKDTRIWNPHRVRMFRSKLMQEGNLGSIECGE